MKRISIELGLNLTHDKELVKLQYDKLQSVKLKEHCNCVDMFLDFQHGQSYLVIVLESP